ncbi:MAG: phosphoribosylanthranilate isomerase [Bacteroidota bacterium]
MKLKVCGMKHPENIEQLLRLEPDFMGLIFYPKSPRNVDGKINPARVRSLNTLRKVGVFVNESLEKIMEKIQEYGLDLIQLHGQEKPELCRNLQERGVGVIKVFSIGSGFDFDRLRAYEAVVDYFLFDTKGKHPGGNGVVFNWDILQEYPSNVPFFLSGGIGPESLDRLNNLKLPNLYAVDVNSRFELEPGLKDISALQHFTQHLSSHSPPHNTPITQ